MARLVLSLPAPRAEQVARRLVEQGHEALPLAFSALESLAGTPSAQALMCRLAGFERVVLVSPTAVECFVQALAGPWPATLAPAVVGPGSLAALARHGVDRHPGLLVPAGPAFDADALLALPALAAPRGGVLVVRAEGGNQQIERTLAARGAQVAAFEAYRRHAVQPDQPALRQLARWVAEHPARPAHLVVTTVDAADRLAGLADAPGGPARLRQVPALAIHARIADRLSALGWESASTIDPGFDGLLAALESEHGVTKSSLRSGFD